jgi:hypothetical protein
MSYPVIPVRWRADQPMAVRTFELAADHPLAGCACPMCRGPIAGGTRVVLLALGPDPEDEDAIGRHEAGRWYTADGVMAHELCGSEADIARPEPPRTASD